ncbi:hypothetical protein [Nostoc sp. CALU 1950]|uniref:hypothetical protein n=1 Tax=Nostoc sp. CALU 1950 TaxID=3104321 RepID=UPI003EBF2CF5
MLADLGWSQAFEAALLKLLAAMPAANRQQAEMVSQRIHVDPTGWHRWDKEMSAFATLQTAICLVFSCLGSARIEQIDTQSCQYSVVGKPEILS